MPAHAKEESKKRLRPWLLAGDLVVCLLATLVGFAAQDELTGASTGRFLVTLAAFVLAWILLALALSLFDPRSAVDRRRLWRPYLAGIFCAPLGGWIRGLFLETPARPNFILVMAAVTSAMMLVWRMGYLFLARRRAF